MSGNGADDAMNDPQQVDHDEDVNELDDGDDGDDGDDWSSGYSAFFEDAMSDEEAGSSLDGTHHAPLCEVVRGAVRESVSCGCSCGCEHYTRYCKIVAPCCDKTYWCRFCHDSAEGTTTTSRDPVTNRIVVHEGHQVDRNSIKEVICARCDTRQSVSPKCSACGTVFAVYFCSVCNLFDDHGIAKDVFHCDGCGVCRVGGRNNFLHCDSCGYCYSVKQGLKHKCVTGALDSNCPVCQEYLFTSRLPVQVFPCGHTIHIACFEKFQKAASTPVQAYRCPLCNKSIGDLTSLWRVLDEHVADTQMPEEYKSRKVDVRCNDCSAASNGIPMHVIGHKCSSCGGYNTAIV